MHRWTKKLKDIMALLRYLPHLFLTGMSLQLLSQMIGYMHVGLDLTDEGFYISAANWAAEDFLQLTMFGDVTGVFLHLVDQDIARFRLIGLLLLIGGASLLAFSVGRSIQATAAKSNRGVLSLFILTGALGSLTYYGAWLPTPSYNSLAIIAVSLSVSMMLIVSVEIKSHAKKMLYTIQPSFWLYCSVLGIALTIAYMAKPSTAAVLAVITVVWFLPQTSAQTGRLAILISGGTSFFTLLVFIHFYKGGVGAYIEKSIISFETMRVLGTSVSTSLIGNSWEEIKTGILGPPIDLLYIAVLSALYGLVSFVVANSSVSKSRLRQGAAVMTVLAITYLVVQAFLDSWLQGGPRAWANGLLLFQVVLLSAVMYLSSCLATRSLPSLSHLAISLLLVTCSFAVGFGSTSGIFGASSMALFLYYIAILIFADGIDRNSTFRLTLPFVGILLSIATHVIVSDGFRSPYRVESSLDQQMEQVSLFGKKSHLSVDSKTAMYINDLQTLAGDEEGTSESYLLDFTGATPLASVILDFKPLAAAWLIGGYQGSLDVAKMRLDRIDKNTIRSAWILYAPKGGRRISIELLTEYGLDLDKDYQLVGTVTTAYRDELQQLWKPVSVKEKTQK